MSLTQSTQYSMSSLPEYESTQQLDQFQDFTSQNESSFIVPDFPESTASRSTRFSQIPQRPLVAPNPTFMATRPNFGVEQTLQSFVIPDLENITELVSGTHKNGTPNASRAPKSSSRFANNNNNDTLTYARLSGVTMPGEEKAIATSMQLMRDKIAYLQTGLREKDLLLHQKDVRIREEIMRRESHEDHISNLMAQIELQRELRRPDSALGSETDHREVFEVEIARLKASSAALEQRQSQMARKEQLTEIELQKGKEERRALFDQLGDALAKYNAAALENKKLKQQIQQMKDLSHKPENPATSKTPVSPTRRSPQLSSRFQGRAAKAECTTDLTLPTTHQDWTRPTVAKEEYTKNLTMLTAIDSNEMNELRKKIERETRARKDARRIASAPLSADPSPPAEDTGRLSLDDSIAESIIQKRRSLHNLSAVPAPCAEDTGRLNAAPSFDDVFIQAQRNLPKTSTGPTPRAEETRHASGDNAFDITFTRFQKNAPNHSAVPKLHAEDSGRLDADRSIHASSRATRNPSTDSMRRREDSARLNMDTSTRASIFHTRNSSAGSTPFAEKSGGSKRDTSARRSGHNAHASRNMSADLASSSNPQQNSARQLSADPTPRAQDSGRSSGRAPLIQGAPTILYAKTRQNPAESSPYEAEDTGRFSISSSTFDTSIQCSPPSQTRTRGLSAGSAPSGEKPGRSGETGNSSSQSTQKHARDLPAGSTPFGEKPGRLSRGIAKSEHRDLSAGLKLPAEEPGRLSSDASAIDRTVIRRERSVRIESPNASDMISYEEPKESSEMSMISTTSRRRQLNNNPEEMTSAFILPDITLSNDARPQAAQSGRGPSNISSFPSRSRAGSALIDGSMISEFPSMLEIDEMDVTLRPSQPPAVALAAVMKQLEDEVTVSKKKLANYEKHYAAHDPAVSRSKRRAIKARIEGLLEEIERKSDQIYGLQDVVAGQEKAAPVMERAEMGARLASMGFDIDEYGEDDTQFSGVSSQDSGLDSFR